MHRTHQAKPYIWSRTLETGGRTDRVLVAMDVGEGEKSVPVFGVFRDGTELIDGYSGAVGTVENGMVTLSTGSSLRLLGERW